MPELPEVEAARSLLEREARHREIVTVDDGDRRQCRPHPAGEIRDALLGRTLVGCHRQGKTLWCSTSGLDGDQAPGRRLALHLGMTGQLLVVDGQGDALNAHEPSVAADGNGDGSPRRRYPSAAELSRERPEWCRFSVDFADGGNLQFYDMNRLGRVWLDPDLDALGPDAQRIGLAEFRARISAGTAGVKARLLDQTVLAGVGNLLADEALWQARIDPARPARELTVDESARLHRQLRRVIASAIRKGGAGTGTVIAHRRRGGQCPRCGTLMARGTVGGRTTWWCPKEQA